MDLEQTYKINSWFNDEPSDHDYVGVQGKREYIEQLKFTRRGGIMIEEYAKDTRALAGMYRMVLYIADRMLSRVWHPSEGIYTPSVSTCHPEDMDRIVSAVTRLQMEIKSCKEYGWYLKVKHVKNVRSVDDKLMDVYAQGQLCMRIAEKHYPADDATEWKPEFNDMMGLLWVAHMFIRDQHLYRTFDKHPL